MLLPLTFYGNALLRKKCLPVTEFDAALRKLADDMIETMDSSNGIGLAAPQIGRDMRFFVLRNYEETPDGHITLTHPQAYVNPRITFHSEESQTDVEGCLSIPGIQGVVERPLKIVIEAFDLDGKLFVEEVAGYKARVILHENDHLNGVLFIDRLDAKMRKSLELALKELKKNVK